MSWRSYSKYSAQGKRCERKGATEEVQLPLFREELALMQDSLSRFATEMGLRIAAQRLEDEVTRRCGPQ